MSLTVLHPVKPVLSEQEEDQLQRMVAENTVPDQELFFGKHIYRLRTPLTANDPDESVDPEPAQPLGGFE